MRRAAFGPRAADLAAQEHAARRASHGHRGLALARSRACAWTRRVPCVTIDAADLLDLIALASTSGLRSPQTSHLERIARRTLSRFRAAQPAGCA